MQSRATIKKIESFLILGKWLSPFANNSKSPNVNHEILTLKTCKNTKENKKISIHVFKPLKKKISGVILVAPGLHPLGPKDPRFFRLNSILAACGNLVFSPSIEDYTNMKITEQSIKDFTQCFETLVAYPERPRDSKITIFSISLGSLLSIKLASNPLYHHDINSLIIFGGYGNWTSMCCDIINKSQKQKETSDIRNIPAIFKHLIDALISKEHKEQADIIGECWREYIHITWVDDKYKNTQLCLEIAQKIAQKIEEPFRDIFYLGCGFREDYHRVFFESIQKLNLDHLDPLSNIKHLKCKTYLIHGKDDELISFGEQKIIAKAISKNVDVSTYATGFYKHSKCETPLNTLKQIKQGHKELKIAVKILWALSCAPLIKN